MNPLTFFPPLFCMGKTRSRFRLENVCIMRVLYIS